jgi:hypothetical protein
MELINIIFQLSLFPVSITSKTEKAAESTWIWRQRNTYNALAKIDTPNILQSIPKLPFLTAVRREVTKQHA